MNNKIIGLDFSFYGDHEKIREHLKKIFFGEVYEPFWKGRSVRLLDLVIDLLAELKKTEGEDITLRTIYEHMSLDGLVCLGLKLRNNDVDASKIALLDAYLSDLPGFYIVDGKYSEINERTKQQQGYISMIVINSINYLSNQMEEDLLC